MKQPLVIKIALRLLVLLSFFFYLYSVQLKYMPAGTRILLALMGLIILVFKLVKESEIKKDVFISRKLIIFFSLFVLIVFVSFFSIVLNNTRDLEFIKYPFSIVLILLAGYFIHFLIRNVHENYSAQTVMYYIVFAVVIQVVLSLVSFLVPSVTDFLNNIQNYSSVDIFKLEETGVFRLNGFGSTFFGAGIVNGFTLIGIAFLLKSKNISFRVLLMLSLAFLLIFVLGMMMSRTTLIGFLLAFGYLLLPSTIMNVKLIKNKIWFFVGLLLLPLAGGYIISIFSPSATLMLENAANFGFEMFVSYQQSGEFSSLSTDRLQTMYVFPTSFKTYLIGDGKYYLLPGDPSGGYYMGTDVGYLRLIYYFGISGSVIYFLLQASSVYSAAVMNTQNRELRRFLLFGLLFCFILNLKGFTDILFLTTLFCYQFKSENVPTDSPEISVSTGTKY